MVPGPARGEQGIITQRTLQPDPGKCLEGLLGFIQMSVAGLLGIAVGHGYDGTPVAMALAIATTGLLSLAVYLLLLRGRPLHRAVPGRSD